MLHAAREAADAELRLQPRRRPSGCDGAHELPARDPAGRGHAGQVARRDFLTSGRALVHRRNCVGCHVIEGDGRRLRRSCVAEPTLGPPLLTPEGARVQPDWLYAFLRGPITIRPWLNVRMPTFGLDDQNLNGVIRYFGAVSDKMGPFRRHES